MLWSVGLILLASNVLAAVRAGDVVELKGVAEGQAPGEGARRLREGDPLYDGDSIKTMDNSNIHIKLLDNSRFRLGPNAQMVVANFKYQTDSEPNVLATTILKGTFRFISGLIAKASPRSMSVKLPTATIGIRGTHVIGEVTGTSASVALLEPEESGTKTAIEVSNQYGSVVIDEPGFGTDIADEFSPPSPPHRVQVNRINNMLNSIQIMRRLSVPRPIRRP